MIKLDFVPLEQWSAVHKYRPFALGGHKEIPTVPQADRCLLSGHLRSWTLQAQVHVNTLVPSAAPDNDLVKQKTELLQM